MIGDQFTGQHVTICVGHIQTLLEPYDAPFRFQPSCLVRNPLAVRIDRLKDIDVKRH